MNIRTLREKIRYWRTHKFVRNTAILQVGNTIGNIVQALVGVLLARFLEPTAFGVYALVFSLAGLISIFMATGAQDAVTTILGESYAQNDHAKSTEAFGFLGKMTVITGAMALAGAFIAPYLAHVFYHDYHIGIYAGVIILASIISTTFYSFTTIGLQVTGRIKAMTSIGLLDQMSRTLLALTFVILGFGVPGIVLGHFIGASIVCVVSYVLWHRLQKEFPFIPSARELVKTMWLVPLKKYFGRSLWIAIDRNLSNLYNILPVLLTGIFVAKAEVSYFKIAFSYINFGVSFLGPIGTLLNVEFPKMNVLKRDRLAANFIRVSLYALAISAFLTTGAVIVAPFAFRIFYGVKYAGTIPYVRGLFVYGALMGIGIGLGSILRALNRVTFAIKLHIVNVGLGVPLGLLIIKNFGAWGTVILVTAWYTIAHFVAFFYVLRVLKNQESTNV